MFNNNKLPEKLGNDERPIKNNDVEIKRIIELNEKKKVLDFLQSNQKSIYDKIDKINEFYGNSPTQIDLSKGGLFKDWDFEF
jgi:hypothetical protein